MQCLRAQLIVQDYQCLNLGSVTYSFVALRKVTLILCAFISLSVKLGQ